MKAEAKEILRIFLVNVKRSRWKIIETFTLFAALHLSPSKIQIKQHYTSLSNFFWYASSFSSSSFFIYSILFLSLSLSLYFNNFSHYLCNFSSLYTILKWRKILFFLVTPSATNYFNTNTCASFHLKCFLNYLLVLSRDIFKIK